MENGSGSNVNNNYNSVQWLVAVGRVFKKQTWYRWFIQTCWVTAYVALGFMTYVQARETVCAYVTCVLGKKYVDESLISERKLKKFRHTPERKFDLCKTLL